MWNETKYLNAVVSSQVKTNMDPGSARDRGSALD